MENVVRLGEWYLKEWRNDKIKKLYRVREGTIVDQDMLEVAYSFFNSQ